MKELNFECSKSHLTDLISRIRKQFPESTNPQVLGMLVLWSKEQADSMVKKGKKYSASIGNSKTFGGLIDFTATSGNNCVDAIEFDTPTFVELGFTLPDMFLATNILTVKLNFKNL